MSAGFLFFQGRWSRYEVKVGGLACLAGSYADVGPRACIVGKLGWRGALAYYEK